MFDHLLVVYLRSVGLALFSSFPLTVITKILTYLFIPLFLSLFLCSVSCIFECIFL